MNEKNVDRFKSDRMDLRLPAYLLGTDGFRIGDDEMYVICSSLALCSSPPLPFVSALRRNTNFDKRQSMDK